VQTSIIIATRARPASLARLLDSLIPQLIVDRHELFVAENGTPAPLQLSPFSHCLTWGRNEERVSALGSAAIHLHEPLPGKCRIQNRALAHASGEIIVCLDDDLTVAPDYIAQVERFFRDNLRYSAMKGRILPAEDPTAKAGALAPYLDLPIVDHGEAVIEVRGVMGANMAFRAAALRAVGPFDERLGPGAAGHEEETEISQRLRAAGFRIGYAPHAVAWHEVDPARADRARFIRVARERGYCRTLHEHHSLSKVALNILIASARLAIARALMRSPERIAREEHRLAVSQGMRAGLMRGAQ